MLQVMRSYIRTFFGCQECSRHFEQAVAAGIHEVKSAEQQIVWLWNQHNRVNARLAGLHRRTQPQEQTTVWSMNRRYESVLLLFLRLLER